MFDWMLPEKVKQVIAHLKTIDDDQLRSLRGGTVISNARKDVLGNKKDVCASVNEVGAEVVAWIAVWNAAYKYIIYGAPFSYRGVLTLNGRDALAVWMAANRKLVELGNHTNEEADRETANLLKEIENLG